MVLLGRVVIYSPTSRILCIEMLSLDEYASNPRHTID